MALRRKYQPREGQTIDGIRRLWPPKPDEGFTEGLPSPWDDNAARRLAIAQYGEEVVNQAIYNTLHAKEVATTERTLARRSRLIQSKIAYFDQILRITSSPVCTVHLGTDEGGWEYAADYYRLDTDNAPAISIRARRESAKSRPTPPQTFAAIFTLIGSNIALQLGNGEPEWSYDCLSVTEKTHFLDDIDHELEKQELTMGKAWPAFIDPELNPQFAPLLVRLGLQTE